MANELINVDLPTPDLPRSKMFKFFLAPQIANLEFENWEYVFNRGKTWYLFYDAYTKNSTYGDAMDVLDAK